MRRRRRMHECCLLHLQQRLCPMVAVAHRYRTSMLLSQPPTTTLYTPQQQAQARH